MKTNALVPKIAVAATSLLLLSGMDGWALTPRSREACGVVQKIDQETHTLTILPEKKGQTLNVVWKRDTRFIHNWKLTHAVSVKEGLRACVYYRSPFFGKPFVTRVVWVNGA